MNEKFNAQLKGQQEQAAQKDFENLEKLQNLQEAANARENELQNEISGLNE